MAVYTISGASTNVVYNLVGIRLVQVYDIGSNPLLPVGQRLRVMSYNVQWFRKINSQIPMQQKILSDNNPDIIGLQELSQDGNIPSVGQTVLSGYTTILSNHNNYLGVSSKLPLYGTVTADFANQDPNDISAYNQTRAYINTYFDFNGKKICLLNSHLCLTPEYIYLQMQELFDMAEDEEYVIITADFNTHFSSFGSYYDNTYKRFVDAGYHVLNNAPESGITNTHTSSATATSLSQLTGNPDSIIVSGNIEVESIHFDTTKFQYLDGNPIDHIAVATTLVVH